MKFQTESGSVYEVDQDKKQIRRIFGVNNTTVRQSENWKTYSDIFIKIGMRAYIFWDPTTTPLLQGSPEGSIPSTVTSKVVKIEMD